MTLEQHISLLAKSAVKALYDVEATDAQIQLQKTRPEFEGNITLVVFPFVKLARKAPAQVAAEIGEWLKANGEGLIANFNAVQGFLNLSISDAFWVEQLKDIDIPLIYVGGVQSGDNCQQIMDEGFELFQIAHVLIKDPEFVHHVQQDPHYHAGCGRSNYCVGRMYTKNMKCHECVLRDGEKIAPRIQREIAELEANAKKSVEEQKHNS